MEITGLRQIEFFGQSVAVAELTRLVQQAGLFDDGSMAPDRRSSIRRTSLRADEPDLGTS